MADNEETEETNADESTEYVTKGELEEMLEKFVSRFTGDSLPETETTDEADEVLGTMSPAEIERLMEEKVAEAMKKLAAKKPAKASVKKATVVADKDGVRRVETEKPKKADVEEAPTQPGKRSLAERLWGAK